MSLKILINQIATFNIPLFFLIGTINVQYRVSKSIFRENSGHKRHKQSDFDSQS